MSSARRSRCDHRTVHGVIDHIELRAERPDGDATQVLFGEYRALIQDRLGLQLQPTEPIPGRGTAFGGDSGAWLVVYDSGCPIGCGGLRTLEPGVAEIQNMFVSQRCRRNGHGRRLLRELERIAVERGHDRVRALTTEVLSEARKLYAAEGYRVVQRIARKRAPVEIWLEKDVPDPRARTTRRRSDPAAATDAARRAGASGSSPPRKTA